MTKAIVIGSGIAGLASALRLRAKGYEVHLYEANDFTGGKLNSLKKGSYRWDMGPSLLTMPHLIDELFELFDKDPKTYFNYTKNKTLCHYFWEDHTIFKAAADQKAFVTQAAQTFDENPKRIAAYLERAKNKYQLTGETFLFKNLYKLSTWLTKSNLNAIKKFWSLDIFSSLHRVNARFFKSKKIVQLFDRYATYNGSSPYKTSGIMSMIPHLEMYIGSFFPTKGMISISQSLTQLALDQGVHIHLNSKVTSIEHKDGKITGICIGQEMVKSDIVICNMDIYGAYTQLLSNVKVPKKTLKLEKSSSAIIFYWGMDKQFEQLDLHNIFFSDNYKKEFQYLFGLHKIYADPTVYVHISSKQNPADAPEGHENWFVMVNVPEHNKQNWNKELQKVKQSVISKLERLLKEDVSSHIQEELVITPKEIETLTLSHKGALYGPSSNSMMAAFARHANHVSDISGLYFCGGSVHPGGGLPLCLSSAKIACEDIPPATTKSEAPTLPFPYMRALPVRYIYYALLWIIHIQGVIGIYTHQAQTYIPMTYLVLLFTFFIMYDVDLKRDKTKLKIFALCFVTGYIAEWLGVHYGLIFGEYSYGANLGIKLSGVPLTIGINWGVLIFCTGTIARHIAYHPILRALLASTLMVTLDIIMEQVSSPLDFWTFHTLSHKAELQNYIGWFSLSFGLQLIFHFFKAHIRLSTAIQIYSIQFVFFLFIYFWFG